MTDSGAYTDIVADIVADISIDIAAEITMTWPP